MTLAQRLIAGRIISTAVAICAVLLLILATSQLLNQSTRIIDASGGWWVVVQLVTLALPGVTAGLLPLAWLVGLMQSYNTMRDNSETVILMGAGRGHGFMLRPAIVLSVLVALLMLGLSLFVEPAANRQMRDVIATLGYQAQTAVIGDGVLRELAPGLFLRAGPMDENDALSGFLVLDRREQGIETLMIAESLRLVRDTDGETQLELVNGHLLVRDLETGLAHSARFGQFIAEPAFFISDAGTRYRARELPSAALFQTLREGGGDSGLWHELIRRLTDWLYPLAFCAIAAWLTVRADLQGLSRQIRGRVAMAQAIGLGALLKVAGLAVPQMVSAPMKALAVGVLVPVLVGAIFAALALVEIRSARTTDTSAVAQ